MPSTQLPHAVLSIRDAAWLCRVNDDTVRRWIKDGSLEAAVSGGVSYEALQHWMLANNRPLLPVAALTTSPEDWPATPAAGPEPVVAEPGSRKHEVTPSSSRERSLRITVRELLAASVHERSELAARDRAITALLDAIEDAGR